MMRKRLFLVLPILQDKSCLQEARRHTPSNPPNHLLVTQVVNPYKHFGPGQVKAGWSELHQFSSDFLAMSCTWLLQCPRKCGSIRVCPGAECAHSRGTRSSVTQEHRAGRKEISSAPCWSIHTALPILQSSLSKMLHPKSSNDGEGCWAHGTTTATKRKLFPSEVINH